MFSTKSAPQFMRFFIVCALTLFLQCFALPNTVEKIGDDETFQSFKTRRILSDSDGISDMTIFFIVFSVGLLIILALATYSCKNGCCEFEETDPDAGATVHPPPRHLNTVPPQVHVPPVNPNFAYDNPSYTVPPPAPQPGFVSPFRTPASAPPAQDNFGDRPPDYATVAMSDLRSDPYGQTFLEVKKTLSTPPPKFEDSSPSLK